VRVFDTWVVDTSPPQPVVDESGTAITNTYLYEGRPRQDNVRDGRD
jgi:hypothetical protein